MLRRTSSDLASMSRAAQRKERLLQIENEQRIEEAEALKMTEVRYRHNSDRGASTQSPTGAARDPPPLIHFSQSRVQRP